MNAVYPVLRRRTLWGWIMAGNGLAALGAVIGVAELREDRTARLLDAFRIESTRVIWFDLEGRPWPVVEVKCTNTTESIIAHTWLAVTIRSSDGATVYVDDHLSCAPVVPMFPDETSVCVCSGANVAVNHWLAIPHGEQLTVEAIPVSIYGTRMRLLARKPGFVAPVIDMEKYVRPPSL